MTTNEVRAMVAREIEAYRPSRRAAPGTLGQPWPEDLVRAHITELKSALVEPALVYFECRDTSDEMDAEPPIVREYWLIARVSHDVVYFDEEAGVFGLAQVGSTGLPSTIGVRGDLVGTFCAR